MTAPWLYTSEGQSPYYQDGNYIYSKEGSCKFSVFAGWWHDIETGKAKFYVVSHWVNSTDGKPAYYFG